MSILSKSIVLAALFAALGTTSVFGQDEQQQGAPPQSTQPAQPDQPAQGQSQNGATDNGDANIIPAIVQPDLQASNGAGAFRPTFELPPDHSYVLPRFDFTSSVNTNGAYSSVPGQSQLVTQQYLLGGVTIEKVGRANELSVNYLGGRSFSTDGDLYNATTNLFGLNDKWMSGRWAGTLSDQLSYASDTYFGGGVGSPGFAIPGSNIQPSFNPSQALVVGRIPILNNNAVAEFDYQTNPRGTLTFVAGYTLLHYYGTGLINNDSILGEAGYSYQLSRRNSLAVEYLFDAIRFGGNAQTINENVVEATYVYQIARQLSFRVGAGPDVSLIQGQKNYSDTYVSWRLTSSLNYQVRQRTTLGIAYSHMLTGGSGVFLGAETDSVTASVGQQLGRFWSVNMNVGYSRNAALSASGITAPVGTYNTVYGGGGISRLLGRDWKVYVNYQGTYQTSTLGVCTTPPCNSNFSNQQVFAGFGWHPRGFALE
ncbi:MAG TPA: hypothetical protein VMU43_14430 [Candidatus Acidoferrum sp.]|nr:hypothetical protein [Candidatus Acidoferrum sp.]